jgi:hypothetical protein
MARAFAARRRGDSRESFTAREQVRRLIMTEDEIAERIPRAARRQRMSDLLGRFYFRYPNGESRADVAQRMAIFIGKIQRSRYRHHVLFLHGVTQRAFRMAWSNYPVEWFEAEPNLNNASVLVMRRGAERNGWVSDTQIAPGAFAPDPAALVSPLFAAALPARGRVPPAPPCPGRAVTAALPCPRAALARATAAASARAAAAAGAGGTLTG